MERSSCPSKPLFLLQFLLLSQLLEAQIPGPAYDYKRLVASDGDDNGAVLSSPHLNLNLNLADDDDALDRPSKYTPPAPKPGPSPHQVSPHRNRRDEDGAQEQQRSPRASSPTPTGPAPPRDYSRQQPEAAGHPPSRPGKMMDVFRAFLQPIRYVR